MVLESACIPLPSEVIMPFGGYLAAVGHLSLWTVIVAGTVGNVVGSWIAYAVGRLGGRPLLARYGRVVRLSERHLEAAEAWFAKHGEWAVFVGRLLPGIRTFISLPAGIARMPVAKFTVYTAIGSLPWAGLLAYGGFKLGQNWDTVSHYTKPLMAIAVLVIVALIVYIAIRVRRGRRA
ncbi:MAG: DedA family protein [Alicyclobacillus sp.]|nr:DedA family protein [Alicyclobacillus sp.]